MTTVETSKSNESLGERHVSIWVDRCAGCQECVVRCPSGALSMEPVTWTAFADDALCVGCRQCERTCPFSAIHVEGPLALGERFDPALYSPVQLRGNVEETRRGYDTWEEAIAEANRCLDCPDPTCVRGCPAHNNIPQFVAAVRDHDLARAHDILRLTSVIPDVCSRVCNQAAQCEGACTWSLAGGVPVAIGRLERFIADHAPVPAPSRRSHDSEALSVAIVGSGPAGIGAAWDLVEAGAIVTVYERDATPGGLLNWGMPDFTLPDAVATRPWRQLVDAGVDLRCDTTIAPEEIDELLNVHDALIMANGAGGAIRLSVPGAELAGVVDATYFLKGAKRALEPGGDFDAWCDELALGNSTEAPRVLVLGAGNTAMDVARMARRLGFDATCVDWLDERFALARPDELAEARHEGVDVRFSRTLTKIVGEQGRVARAHLSHTEQKEHGVTPKVLERHDDVGVDLVVMAMGYRVDTSFKDALPSTPIVKRATGFAPGRWSASGILKNAASAYNHHSPVGALALDREVGLWRAAMPVRERVWVAGDALTGPASVVEAMAQGRRAARSLLDARPSRPDRSVSHRAQHATRVLVCYASEGGTTKTAAQRVADQLSAHGARPTVLSIDAVGVAELAAADALVVGTWVEGLVLARVGPAKTMCAWLEALPPLGGRPVAAFCTYGVNPRSTLAIMTKLLEAKGATVIATESFGPHDQSGSIRPHKPEAFANRVAARVVAKQPQRSLV